MDIISLTKNFKELAEWQAFCSAQYKQIISLTKEIVELKEKNLQLEKLISKTTPLIKDPAKKDDKFTLIQGLSDEEAIAVTELSKLKDLVLERPLDAVETKQYEIYTKTLQSLRQKKKLPELEDTEKLSDEEILTLVEK